MSLFQYTYYIILFGGWEVEGNDCHDYAGGGVQNWAKVDYVICARSPNQTGHNLDRATTQIWTDSVFTQTPKEIFSEYITNTVQCASLYSDLVLAKICTCTSSQLCQDSGIIKLFITETKYIRTGLTL